MRSIPGTGLRTAFGIGVGVVFAACARPKPTLVTNPIDPHASTLRGSTLLVANPVMACEASGLACVSDAEQREAEEIVTSTIADAAGRRRLVVKREPDLDDGARERLSAAKRRLADAGIVFKPVRRREELGQALPDVEGIDIVALPAIRWQQHFTVDGQAERTTTVVLALLDQRRRAAVWVNEVVFRGRPTGTSGQLFAMGGLPAVLDTSARSPRSGLVPALQLLVAGFPAKEAP